MEKFESQTPEQGKAKDPILLQTIYNEEAKEKRSEEFNKAWEERWHPKGVKEGYFQTSESESPFSQFSSKGWKVHLAFEKGKEKEMSKILYENGLYFKTEAGSGTYFNGLKESGATIYIGCHDSMKEIAEMLEKNAGGLLRDGVTAKNGDKVIRMGSGADIEIRPKITARFDVAKTKFGWLGGNGKYAENGLPSWTNMGGIPILKSNEKEASQIVSRWNSYSDYQRGLYIGDLKNIYQNSKKELEKDFGKEFLLGKNKI